MMLFRKSSLGAWKGVMSDFGCGFAKKTLLFFRRKLNWYFVKWKGVNVSNSTCVESLVALRFERLGNGGISGKSFMEIELLYNAVLG